MKIRLFAAVVVSLALSYAAAQSPDQGQNPDQGNAPQNSGQGRGQSQRGGRGGGFGMMGRGTVGTVTEVAPDHYTIRTELGETYTVHYSVNTRIMKQPPGQQRRGQSQGQGEADTPRTPPTPIKADEIKVGDVIAASGEVDSGAKSVGAVFVMLIDPERAKEMREMEANFGKTWLAGRVTAINDVTVTLQGGPKNETHTFVADENTTFRKRRDPVTLADIQVGDMVRVEGAIKGGNFLATSVAVMGAPPNGERSRGAEGAPVPAPPQ
jgi:Domain of unknown function (DUF5666)